MRRPALIILPAAVVLWLLYRKKDRLRRWLIPGCLLALSVKLAGRLDGLLDNLRSDAVARKLRNLHFHIFVSTIFNILRVALMAASVWSESIPRVLNSLPWKFQVMEAATKASVRPPGGMVTW